jgi:hypothetical protein
MNRKQYNYHLLGASNMSALDFDPVSVTLNPTTKEIDVIAREEELHKRPTQKRTKEELLMSLEEGVSSGDGTNGMLILIPPRNGFY